MKIDDLSNEAQEGLRKWAVFQHDDELLFDALASTPTEWAWALIELKVAEDRAEWFPKGKWATLQVIEGLLMVEAKAGRREAA